MHRLLTPVRETSERNWLLSLIGSQPLRPRIDDTLRADLKALREPPPAKPTRRVIEWPWPEMP